MAMIFIDGLDYASVEAEVLDKWDAGSSIGTFSTSTGRFGGGRVRNSNSQYLGKSFPGVSTVMVGLAIEFTESMLSEATFIQFREDVDVHIRIRANHQGILTVTHNSIEIGRSIGFAFTTGNWHYVEAKCFVHDSTGTVEVYVDGVKVIDLGPIDTRNGGSVGEIDEIRFYGHNSRDAYYDDFYIADTSGGAPQNDILGDLRIDQLMPDGDGNYTQFGTTFPASPTTHWDKVEEIGPDDDTSYNNATGTAEIDTFTMEALAAITTQTIFAVQQFDYLKHDGTAANYRSKLRISGSDFNGASQALTSAYQYLVEMWDTDPNNGAWTESVINGMESGYEEIA